MLMELWKPAMNKTHISLHVNDLGKAVDFYRKLFRAEPAKRKPGYANFDLDNPPLKLALNESTSDNRLSHLGVQVSDSQAVEDAAARFTESGLSTRLERDTDCCYALQDKAWVADPDGNAWEIFTVKNDSSAPASAGCNCGA